MRQIKAEQFKQESTGKSYKNLFGVDLDYVFLKPSEESATF